MRIAFLLVFDINKCGLILKGCEFYAVFQIVLMSVRNSILESSLFDYHMIQSEVSENSCDAHCYDKLMMIVLSLFPVHLDYCKIVFE